MRHIGVWRGIEFTQFEISTVGYRYYNCYNGKIIEHWALIDGISIENQLKEASKGAKSNSNPQTSKPPSSNNL